MLGSKQDHTISRPYGQEWKWRGRVSLLGSRKVEHFPFCMHVCGVRKVAVMQGNWGNDFGFSLTGCLCFFLLFSSFLPLSVLSSLKHRTGRQFYAEAAGVTLPVINFLTREGHFSMHPSVLWGKWVRQDRVPTWDSLTYNPYLCWTEKARGILLVRLSDHR